MRSGQMGNRAGRSRYTMATAEEMGCDLVTLVLSSG